MRRQFSAASLGFGHVVWSVREACPKVQAELERVLARDVAHAAKLAAQEAELAGLRSASWESSLRSALYFLLR